MIEENPNLDEEKLKKYVGNRIREERLKKKWEQKDLAEKIGVKYNTISSYESGTNAPKQHLLFKLAKVFGINVNDLFPAYEKENVDNELEKVVESIKKFGLKDMYLVMRLIEKALSLSEREREMFFDNIEFLMDRYDKFR